MKAPRHERLAPRAQRAKLGALALTLLSVATTQAHGYAVTGSRWNTRSLPIRYRVNASSAPASLGAASALSAVRDGFASWEAPACTAWRSQYDGATSVTLAATGDGENSVLWLASGWNADPRNNPMGDVRSTIGVTQTSRIVGGATAESDISFNAQGFRWSTTGTGGTVDAQSIATHEEGHFLGLDHTPTAAAIMYASYSSGLKRDLHSDDIAGVCALYPSGSTSTDAGVRDTGVRDTGSGSPGTTVGAACSDMVSCASGLNCVCDRSTSACFCTRSCSTSSPCPSDFLCTRTSLGSLCVPDPSGTMMMMPGTGATGDPCASGDECASGICVQTQTGQTFCTEACVDDCSCPALYRCAATTSGTNVCAPGTNQCRMTTPDAGLRDASVRDVAVRDVETPAMPDAEAEDDASVPSVMEAGRPDASTGGSSPGCACAVPGAAVSLGDASQRRVAWALFAAVSGALVLRRRRRTRAVR